MTVERKELEKMAEVGGWNNPEATIDRIMAQSANRTTSKDITKYGRHVDGEIETEAVIKGIAEFEVLSTGKYNQTTKDGDVVEVNVDKMLLEEMADNSNRVARKVYVGHQKAHTDNVAFLSNFRVQPSTEKEGQYKLLATSVFPKGDVDVKLQERIMDGISKKAITKSSSTFKFGASTLSDNNTYVTNAYIDELSILPPVGYALEDDSGLKTRANMVPRSDSCLISFSFSKGQIDIYEDSNNKALLNINGIGYKNISATELSGAIMRLSQEDNFVQTMSIGVPISNETDEELKSFSKLSNFELEDVTDNEYMVKGLIKPFFLKVDSGTLSLSTMPHGVRYINKLINNLSDYEKKYINLPQTSVPQIKD